MGKMAEGSRAEARGFRNLEPRTPNFELRIAPFSHISRVTRHVSWTLADFFSILLSDRCLVGKEYIGILADSTHGDFRKRLLTRSPVLS
jgi:hypothetical protein